MIAICVLAHKSFFFQLSRASGLRTQGAYKVARDEGLQSLASHLLKVGGGGVASPKRLLLEW